MCGRAYLTVTPDELEARYLTKKINLPDFRPNFNLSPTHLTPVVLMNEGDRQLELFKWGLVPFWAKDEKVGYKMINARAETITEKPSFRNAFKSRRCIVPLSGFIEWKREDKTKHPFKIYLKDSPILSIAGIWESWKNSEGQELRTFSIITTEANSFMSKIHDRMPVILHSRDEDAWLDSESKPAVVQKLLKPCPSSWLEAVEISSAINSPKNNRPEVLEPVTGEIH